MGAASTDLFGTVVSLGFNLIGTSAGNNLSNWNPDTDIIQENGAPPVNPGLDPNGLQRNGGFLDTVAVLPTSPAYRDGDPSLWLSLDGRAYTRNGFNDIQQSVFVTIGAFDPDAQFLE